MLHPIAGRAMIEHVLDGAAHRSPGHGTLVVGHKADTVRAPGGKPRVRRSPSRSLSWGPRTPCSRPSRCWRPARDRGAAFGRRSAAAPPTPATAGRDAPWRNAAATVVTATGRAALRLRAHRPVPGAGSPNRRGAGRLAAQRQIKEINSGIYAFDLAPLFDALRSIASQNAQGEYYLTDLIAIYRRRKLPVETLVVDNAEEIRGINSRTELAEVSRIVRQKKNEELMAAGVTLIDPATTYIDPDVEIGADTVIHPGVVIEGRPASARPAKSRPTCASSTRRSATGSRSTTSA